MDRFYTIEEIAHLLRMSAGTARNRLSRGDDMPPSMRVGRRRLFPQTAVYHWCSRRMPVDGGVHSDTTENDEAHSRRRGRPRSA
jgi:excisionase family DNA binding protein